MKNYKFQIIFFLFAGLMIQAVTSCETQAFRQGEILYSNFCANCHMDDGSGLEGVIPPLANSDYIASDPLAVACIINLGQKDTILVNGTRYYTPMPAIPALSGFEITNVMNYINHSWGNNYGFIQYEDVIKELEACGVDWY